MNAAPAAGGQRTGLPGVRRLPRACIRSPWWIWAVALATAASRTTNPLLLLLFLAVLGLVVTARHTDAPWARGLPLLPGMALSVIAHPGRVPGGLRERRHAERPRPVPAAPDPHPVLVRRIEIGGPVSLEAVLSAPLDGAAARVPAVLHRRGEHAGQPQARPAGAAGCAVRARVAVTVALSVAPQLVERVQRVRRARRLRGAAGRGLRAAAADRDPGAARRAGPVVAPGRRDGLPWVRADRLATRASRRLTGALMLTGLRGCASARTGCSTRPSRTGSGLGGFVGRAAAVPGGLALGGRRVRAPLPARSVALARMAGRRLWPGHRDRAVPAPRLRPGRARTRACTRCTGRRCRWSRRSRSWSRHRRARRAAASRREPPAPSRPRRPRRAFAAAMP